MNECEGYGLKYGIQRGIIALIYLKHIHVVVMRYEWENISRTFFYAIVT